MNKPPNFKSPFSTAPKSRLVPQDVPARTPAKGVPEPGWVDPVERIAALACLHGSRAFARDIVDALAAATTCRMDSRLSRR